MTEASAADVARLTGLINRQRCELDRARAMAVTRSVIGMAQGMLMERFGCSASEAAAQLSRLATDSGTPLADLAGEITGPYVAGSHMPGDHPGGGPGGNGAGRQAGGPWAAPPDDGAAAGRAGGPGAATGWRRLSLASAAAAEAADAQEIAEAALREVLEPAGAAAVVLWQLGPDGGLDLAGEAGLGAREAGRWHHVPPEMDCLPQRCARREAELFWPGGRPRGDTAPLIAPWLTGARAVLPMRGPRGVAGVLLSVWAQPLPAFEPPLRGQLRALADLCAQALSAQGEHGDRAVPGQLAWLYGLVEGLVESVLFAAPARAPDGAVTDFRITHVSSGFADPVGRRAADLAGRMLGEVYPYTALPGGLCDLAAGVLASGVPYRGSDGLLSAVGTETGLTALMDIRIARLFDGVVISWRQVDEAERLASLLQHAERLGRIGGWEEDLLAGEARWTDYTCGLFGTAAGQPIPLADLHTRVVPDDLAAVEQFRQTLLGQRQTTAAAFRIVRADDDSVRQMRVFAEPVIDLAGVLVGVRGVFQDVSSSYHTQVALTATRDRLADSEERAEEEHRLAVRLQEAITPWSSERLAAAGLDIAARYRPAGPARLVSGDWYDTVLLPSGKVLLAVGDVAGHGIDAVTGMVELRNTLRGFAITGAGPAHLLGWLNHVACELTGTVGTAFCGLYDPASRRLCWARAGHLPPILVHDGTASLLPLVPGLMLGAEPAMAYEEVTTALGAGDVLLLFTDGLIERRDSSIDEALGALLARASRPVTGIAAYADELASSAGADTGDDACLVAVQVR